MYAPEKELDQAEVKLTIVDEQPLVDRVARLEDELKQARWRAYCVAYHGPFRRRVSPVWSLGFYQDAPEKEVDQAEVKLELSNVKAELDARCDELQRVRLCCMCACLGDASAGLDKAARVVGRVTAEARRCGEAHAGGRAECLREQGCL